MSRPTILFQPTATRSIRSVTFGMALNLCFLAVAANAQFGELLPPAGSTPAPAGNTPPSTGSTPPNGNPFDLPPTPTTPESTATPPGGGVTPPGGGLTPSPNTTTLPDINLNNPSVTPTTPGGLELPAAPTAEEAARAEKAKQVSELIKEGKYNEAEKILNEELAANPKDAGAWYFLGGAQRLQEKLDDAIVSYTKSIEYLPEYGDAYLRRGIVWFKKGDYGVAALDFEYAATLNYNDPRPEMWRGLALSMIGQPRLAIAAHTQAIKFDSLYVPARINRALAYMELEDYSAASLDFNEAVRLEPTNPQHYFMRGVAFAKRNLADRAIASYSDAIRLDPNYAEAYYNRSVTYAQLGKSAEAAWDRAKALELNPALTQSRR